MPWQTPTLREVRSIVRDNIRASLPGADASVPNSVLRVLSDNQGALCHLTLQYVDWLALQLLPDTAEGEWLDRHGNIWLVNADGTKGRKQATFATGLVSFTGTEGAIVPTGTRLAGSLTEYETTDDITLSAAATQGPARALDPGTIGNLDEGATLAIAATLPDVDSVATVVEMTGGVDTESDDDLRTRILLRIRQPPAGGDADDYVNWALAVPGVTRAWCYPMEMGIGTCTVRFMMDDLRADQDGFPLPEDCETVKAYLDTVRPVTVKDLFVEAPIPRPVNLHITWLNVDTPATHGAIIDSLLEEFERRAAPGQTWYRAWSDEGIMGAAGVVAYDLDAADEVMPGNGYMPVLGDVTYG